MAKSILISDESITNKIHIIRGKRVMLDSDLAIMYNVETKRLKEQVRRNPERFPDDFMFELSREEFISLRTQNATLKRGGHSKYLPYVFTEQGVAMLSSILNSKQAIAVNIQIIRVFTRMREMLSTHKEISVKLNLLEQKMLVNDKKFKEYDAEIQTIFNVLKQLLNPPSQPRKKIGFKIKGKP